MCSYQFGRDFYVLVWIFIYQIIFKPPPPPARSLNSRMVKMVQIASQSLKWMNHEREARVIYEGCSNMNASSFITLFTYVLRQNVIPFWKEPFVAVKMAPNIKKHSLYFSSYRPLYKGHSCILKIFWSELQCTFCYMCGYSVISL